MNIYDVVTQRRRALKDLFDSANSFMEPTDREKMLLQHKNDLEKMALEQKNNLDMFKLKSTTEFAQDMFKNKIDFDEDMIRLGYDVWKARSLADLQFNRDLEIERLRQTGSAKTKATELKNQQQLLEDAENKDLAEKYKTYISSAPLRGRKLEEAGVSDYNLAYGDEDYDPYDGGPLFGLGIGRWLTNTLYSAGTMAAAGAGTALVAGQVGPQIALPEEAITVPGMSAIGAIGGAIHAQTEMFGGEGFRKNLGIGFEEEGWKPKKGFKGTMDFAGRTSAEEEKIDELSRKLFPYAYWDPNGEDAKEYPVLYQQELRKRDEFVRKSRVADFDAQSIYEMAVGKEQPIEDKNGEVIGTGFTPSAENAEIDVQMAGDKLYMYPSVEFEKDSTTGAEVVVKSGISLPYGKAVDDANGLLWVNYDTITKRLDTVLSKENIILVEAYLGKQKAGHMQDQRDKLLKYKSDYEQFFKDGYEEATKKGGMYSFSRVTAIINTDITN